MFKAISSRGQMRLAYSVRIKVNETIVSENRSKKHITI